MVMTSDRRGVSCDLCGMEYRDKFEYYSAKVDKVAVDKAASKTGGISDIDRRYMDLDICIGCWDKMVGTVKSVIEKRKAKKAKDKRNKAHEWR